ncbi:MAPEG family protein [Sphingomonas sp. ID0503]|uniref:MAPEG family protein n=1 Tax=Sphingomonas sp. ID0503 TaxID=3399691 RepID=UPI003AFAB65B
MQTEFILLGATIVLALVNIFWAANARTKQYGVTWNMGPRDAEMPALNPLPARLLRAQANLFETFPLFAAALLGAFAAGHFGWKTLVGAHLYFWARLIYLPLYAAGVPKVRTLAFMVATAGLVLITWALIFG